MNRFVRGFGLLTVLSAPMLAHAEAAYLDCELQGDRGDSLKFQVKVDEASGKVTHTQDNGMAFNTEGFFAPNAISYQKIDLVAGLKMTLRYEINRTTLAITRTMAIGTGQPGPGTTGKCELARVADRKI